MLLRLIFATIKEWKPTFANIKQNIPQSKQNIEIIMEFLKSNAKSATDIDKKTIIEVTGLSKSVVYRTFHDEEFLRQFNQAGYNVHKTKIYF